MPLLKFDSPVNRVSGRLAQQPTTYTWNNGAPVLRAQIGPTNPDSIDQQEIRAIFSAVTKNWKLLTQAQRDAWTTWAQSHTVTNRLGTIVKRNGLSAYVELATGNYIRATTLLSAAPTLAQPAAPTSIALGAGQPGHFTLDVEVTHTYTTLTGLYIVVRATPGRTYESQTPKLGDYRLVCGVDATSIQALDTSGAIYHFTSTRYEYFDLQWMGAEITIMNSEGWQSPIARIYNQYQE